MGGRVGELNAPLRLPLRRLPGGLVARPRMPFEVRSRLRGREEQQRRNFDPLGYDDVLGRSWTLPPRYERP